jgi:hypothetical protein
MEDISEEDEAGDIESDRYTVTLGCLSRPTSAKDG